MKTMDTIIVTNEEIARFVIGDGADDAGTEKATLLARRVLRAALIQPDVQEKLTRSRAVEADWQTAQATAAAEPTPDEAARLIVLQNALRRVTQQVAGFFPNDAPAPSDFAHAVLWEAAQLRDSGGGRWVSQQQGLRDVLEAVLQAAQNVQTLLLGRPHPVRLPCFAPALAASAAPSTVLAPRRSETITADGVKIEFQQLPGSGNRVRVLVDTTLLPTPNAATDPASALYNVAFLTLVEGDEAGEPTAAEDEFISRHVLVVALNERGVGFADFAVSSGGTPIERGGKNVFPAPRTGGCSLVSATLSYLPRLPQ